MCVVLYRETDRQTDRQTDRYREKERERERERRTETERQRQRQTEIHTLRNFCFSVYRFYSVSTDTTWSTGAVLCV